MQQKLPPFDFFTGMPDGFLKNQYVQVFMQDIHEFYRGYNLLQSVCDHMILKAVEASWHKDTPIAIAIYQSLIDEKYPLPRPYGLLIGIYRKNKDKSSELEYLRASVDFFSRMKNHQKQDVLLLATRYDAAAYAQAMIDSRRRIMYYANAYVLYDPMPFLQEWEKRIDFLQKM